MLRQSPTLRLRRLATVLTQLRKDAGLTAAEAAKRAGVSANKLTTHERREVVYPDATLVKNLLDIYGVTDPAQREQLLDWTRVGRGNGWWHEAKGLLGDHATYLGMEYEARVLRNFEDTVLPGLLQTEEYTRALIVGRLPGVDEGEVARRVKVRQERQRHLLSGADQLEHLHVVMDEAALLRPVGGRDVMADQLERLIEASPCPNVTLQVLPFSRGIHPAASAFTIFTFGHPLDPEAVYLENPVEELWVEGVDEVSGFIVSWERLVGRSLGVADSVRLIAAVRERLLSESEEYGTHEHTPDLAQVQPQ